jgi:hypothetical protein
MKKVIFLLSAIAFFSNFIKAQCLPDWGYYYTLQVTNNVSSSLTDFQVKISINTSSLISAGKMNSNGNDIRFVDGSTCNTMPYWIESGMNTANTVIWVKVPFLAGSGKKTISMYYGNTAAAAASNGDSTFLVFDDFDGSSLNTTKWSLKKTNSASISVSSGKLVMSCIYNSSTPESVNIRSVDPFDAPIVSEGFVSAAEGYYPFIGIVNAGSDDGYNLFYDSKFVNPPGMYMGKSYYNSLGNLAGTKTYTATNPTNITGIWQYYWPSTNSQKGVWPGGSVSGTASGPTLSNSVNPVIGMLMVSDGTMEIDWFRARKYAETEPGTAVGDEVVNEPAGISETVLETFIHVFPNPANDILNVRTDEKFRCASVKLYDLSGRLIRSVDVTGISFSLNVEDMPTGMYLLKLIGNKGTIAKKVIIR